uniref:Uncharacterized protein n=1 Tax=Arundo donax TaxID=35708 RepID=A0A0A9AJ77_ARUDO
MVDAEELLHALPVTQRRSLLPHPKQKRCTGVS